jgi:hypothetical protein
MYVKGTLAHNETSKIGKTHYTSIYFSKKEIVSPVKIVRGHTLLAHSMSGRVVTTGDCLKFTKAIKDLLLAKHLGHCDVMVRIMHEDAVITADADTRFSLSDINVSDAMNADGSLKKCSLSKIDVSNVVNDDGSLKSSPAVQMALMEGDEDETTLVSDDDLIKI